jgi:ABC-type nitrate/sulfonate/bicarbonate transport system ATPase subunit
VQLDERWLLYLSNVSFTYPSGVQALSSFDLSVRAGEVMSIIGPSGCGKSTLLSIIAGLRPFDGKLAWNRDEIRDGAGNSAGPRLSVVFQVNTVMPWLTVERNVGFGLRYSHLTRAERADRVTRLLEMAGLADFRRARPHELSGGMNRRVALLTGIAPLPRLLILDEPFAALDEPTRIGIHGDLLRLGRQLEMTMMIVTHDLGEAISLSDRICFMTARPGRLAQLVEIPLGSHRDVTKIREEVGYQELYRKLWPYLWRQLEVSGEKADGSTASSGTW